MGWFGAAASKPRGDPVGASAAGAGGASTPSFVGATPPSVPFGIARLQPGDVGDAYGSGGGGGVPAWAWVPRDAEVFAIAEPGQGLADVAVTSSTHVVKPTDPHLCQHMVTPPDVSPLGLVVFANAKCQVPNHQGPVLPRPRLVLELNGILMTW